VSESRSSERPMSCNSSDIIAGACYPSWLHREPSFLECKMGAGRRPDVSRSAEGSRARSPAANARIAPGVAVVRDGRAEPFLDARPTLSSSPALWGGLVLERYAVPALLIPRHQHPEHFLHVVLSGTVKYEVITRGRSLRFTPRPGMLFLLPRGTIDEVNGSEGQHMEDGILRRKNSPH
jgi:hypothetical protein